MKLCLGMDDGQVESRLGLVGDIVLSVCCRLPDQEELVDNAFCR